MPTIEDLFNGLKKNGIYPKESNAVYAENVTNWIKKNNHNKKPNPDAYGPDANSLEDFVQKFTKKVKRYFSDPKIKSHIGARGFSNTMDEWLDQTIVVNYVCECSKCDVQEDVEMEDLEQPKLSPLKIARESKKLRENYSEEAILHAAE